MHLLGKQDDLEKLLADTCTCLAWVFLYSTASNAFFPYSLEPIPQFGFGMWFYSHLSGLPKIVIAGSGKR